MVCVRTSCTVTSLLIAALFPDPLKFGVRDVWIFLGSWCHLGREMRGLITHVSLLNETSLSLCPWHLIGGVAGFLVFAHVGGVGRRKFTAPSTRHLNSGKLYGTYSRSPRNSDENGTLSKGR
ncbi:hypothetical protein FB451DRAFT_1297144 [Mycena latifolia]|nr:hypothetical protein FB451DRAFT_1297144 [Mycena latifolia]